MLPIDKVNGLMPLDDRIIVMSNDPSVLEEPVEVPLLAMLLEVAGHVLAAHEDQSAGDLELALRQVPSLPGPHSGLPPVHEESLRSLTSPAYP